eukprot:gene5126-6382_t
MNFDSLPLPDHEILELMNRDITPDDYELLLQLDSTVKPKTVSQDIVKQLQTEICTIYHKKNYPKCMICLIEFEFNELVTVLDCNHIFHINCISKWLLNSSVNCPLDGLSIIKQDHPPPELNNESNINTNIESNENLNNNEINHDSSKSTSSNSSSDNEIDENMNNQTEDELDVTEEKDEDEDEDE